MSALELRPLDDGERPWLESFLDEHWGGADMLIRGELPICGVPSAIVAAQDGDRLGVLTYVVRGDGCEVTSLDSLASGQGIGTALSPRSAGSPGCTAAGGCTS